MKANERAYVIEGPQAPRWLKHAASPFKYLHACAGDPEEALEEFRDMLDEDEDASAYTVREIDKLQPASLVEAMKAALQDVQHLIRDRWDGTPTSVFDKDAFEADECTCECDFERIFDQMVGGAKQTFVRKCMEAYKALEISTL